MCAQRAHISCGPHVREGSIAPGATLLCLCANYSGIAASYYTNGTWRGLLIPTPAGVSILNADPAVAFTDIGNHWLVWVSSLAQSTALWNSTPTTATGVTTMR